MRDIEATAQIPSEQQMEATLTVAFGEGLQDIGSSILRTAKKVAKTVQDPDKRKNVAAVVALAIGIGGSLSSQPQQERISVSASPTSGLIEGVSTPTLTDRTRVIWNGALPHEITFAQVSDKTIVNDTRIHADEQFIPPVIPDRKMGEQKDLVPQTANTKEKLQPQKTYVIQPQDTILGILNSQAGLQHLYESDFSTGQTQISLEANEMALEFLFINALEGRDNPQASIGFDKVFFSNAKSVMEYKGMSTVGQYLLDIEDLVSKGADLQELQRYASGIPTRDKATLMAHLNTNIPAGKTVLIPVANQQDTRNNNPKSRKTESQNTQNPQDHLVWYPDNAGDTIY